MQHLKNFTKYVPDSAEKLQQAAEFSSVAPVGVLPMFLRDEKNLDWYDAQAKFLTDTVKVAYNAEGTVCDFSKDVTAIVPLNLSVIELKEISVPADIDRSGCWIVQNGTVKARPVDYVALANAQKKALLETARNNIDILQFADSQGIASDKEKALLDEWQLFRLSLSRLDTTTASDVINWPESPEDVA